MNHPASKSIYVIVWLALMALLFVTWGVACFDLGIANPIAALGIAFVKMCLVILFFMQVRYHGRMIRLFAGAGFVWFLIMIIFTMTDYLSRHTVQPYKAQNIDAIVSPAPIQKNAVSSHEVGSKILSDKDKIPSE